MSNRVVTAALVSLFSASLLAGAALIAPAKQGQLRYIDKLTIEDDYKNEFGAEAAKSFQANKTPDPDGNMTATYTVDGKPVIFRTNGFLPTDPAMLENNLVISSSSSYETEQTDKESLSLVMMLFQGEKKNLVFNLNGPEAMKLVEKTLASADKPFQNSCLTPTSDAIKSGQRIITANINCDLSLKDLVQIMTQDNALITQHTLISQSLLKQTGAYGTLWSLFDPSYTTETSIFGGKKGTRKEDFAFTQGSSVYMTFVSTPTAMDKGLNFVYKKNK